jgi:amino acid adenylation domain-containing protein
MKEEDLVSVFPLEDLEGSVVERFEKQVSLRPDALAVISGAETLSFEELNKASNRIAHAILERSGPGEETVCLLLEHGSPIIAGALGVLKSGKRYVVLNPSFPPPHLTEILIDSEGALTITNRNNLSLAEKVVQNQDQLLEIQQPNTGGKDHNPGLDISPDTLAAIFYTSGSTRKPKGVLKSHRNILHRTQTEAKFYDFGPQDRISFLFTGSFAASIGNIYGTLLNGGAVCPFDIRAEGLNKLINWLQATDITVLNPPLALFRSLLDTLDGSLDFPSIRMLILGGDSLYKADVARIRRVFHPKCVIAHQLAISEASVTTRYLINPNTEVKDRVIPVGYPDENKEILILDDNGDTVAHGEVGEIAVRSRYLSPGYWKDPELNRRKFLPDPEGGDRRIYLTGDSGRLRSDDCLEHLGRKDAQVKIRGFRVETSVIEAALLEVENIQQAIVIPQIDTRGRKRLTAYILPNQFPGPSSAAVRKALSKEFPNHMIPSILITLDKAPLTLTGKIDRLALPDPDEELRALDDEVVLPETEFEIQLANIWQEVLGIEPIGRDDDFFELGGHSLLAMVLFARIEKRLGRKLPLSSLFQASMLKDQAALLQQTDTGRTWPSLVTIQPHGSKSPFYCASPLIVDALAYRDLALHIGRERPFYALYSHAPNRNDVGEGRVESEAAQFLQEILSFQPDGPYLLGGYSNGGKVALEMAIQLKKMGKQVSAVIMFDTYGPDYRQLLPYISPAIYRRLLSIRRLEMKIENLLPWMKMHFQNLRALDWRGRYEYLRFKGERRIQLLRSWVRRVYPRIVSVQTPDTVSHVGAPRRDYRDYRPALYDGKVILFKAQKQPMGIHQDDELGWGKLISGELVVEEIPGYHDSILFGPRVQFLAKKLSDVLDREGG